jgi:hypothetical protein
VRNGGLWHRPTQTELLIAKLRESRATGRPLELPEIMQAGIAQHGARLFEIRQQGFVVENVIERAADGRIRSRYYLVFDPGRDGLNGK